MEDEMDIFGILAMVGGLALFLYGMQVLGDGLKRTSGGRLEEILESLTSNKWKGALLGCVVTAVIQSSSATTVMVVGLVNSGIMKLTQAAGVILGANVRQKLLATTDFVSLQIHYQVDAALIGGLKIQIGDRVVDSSIQNRLKRMKDSLMRVSLS